MKKPRFRVGQCVVIRATDDIFRIGSLKIEGSRFYYWRTDSSSVGWEEHELRPLTARERGEPKRRK